MPNFQGLCDGEFMNVIYPAEAFWYIHPSFSDLERQPQPITSTFRAGHMVLIMGAYTYPVSDELLAIKVDNLDSLYFIDMSDHPRDNGLIMEAYFKLKRRLPENTFEDLVAQTILKLK